MKRIFAFMTVVAAVASSWAAVPELLFKDQPVVPGEVYETGWFYKVQLPTMSSCAQDAELFLRGAYGTNVTVEVKATDEIQVCSVNGQCEMGTNVTKSGELGVLSAPVGSSPEDVFKPGDIVVINLLIDKVVTVKGNIDPSEKFTNITVNVKAYYTATPGEYTETTVVMTNKPESEIGGVADLEADGTYVHMGYGNTLEYNVASPVKLDLYNVAGALVVSRMVNGLGSISLDTLHPGIYIYSAGEHQGKILVRK